MLDAPDKHDILLSAFSHQHLSDVSIILRSFGRLLVHDTQRIVKDGESQRRMMAEAG